VEELSNEMLCGFLNDLELKTETNQTAPPNNRRASRTIKPTAKYNDLTINDSKVSDDILRYYSVSPTVPDAVAPYHVESRI